MRTMSPLAALLPAGALGSELCTRRRTVLPVTGSVHFHFAPFAAPPGICVHFSGVAFLGTMLSGLAPPWRSHPPSMIRVAALAWGTSPLGAFLLVVLNSFFASDLR